ncbi:hypothetical protein ACFX58_09205 [Sphingomonas sp. NCPPB 2930]
MKKQQAQALAQTLEQRLEERLQRSRLRNSAVEVHSAHGPPRRLPTLPEHPGESSTPAPQAPPRTDAADVG